MCGIMYFDVSGLSEEQIAIVRRAFEEQLVHRGPDATHSIVFQKSSFLGCHRLAIINPEDRAGDQPFEGQKCAVACNGQIYNYRQLMDDFDGRSETNREPHSDVEVLHWMLEEDLDNDDDRTKLFGALDGDFACVACFHDEIVAARDPAGVRPLFYAMRGQTVVGFASEAKALHALTKVVGRTSAEPPLVTEVRVFPPGHVCTLKGGTSGISTSDMSTSGMSTSGMSTSGMSTSGVSTSGMSTSGMSNATFRRYSPLFEETEAREVKAEATSPPPPAPARDSRDSRYSQGSRDTASMTLEDLDFEGLDALIGNSQGGGNSAGNTESTMKRRIVDLLRRAVAKRLDHSHRSVAFLLSGGLDSALIVCLAHEHLAARGQLDRLRTYSVSYEQGVSMDEMHAQLLAERFNIPHTVVRFGKREALEAIPEVIRCCETCDPNTVRAAVPMYFLARYLAEKTEHRVIFSGEGSDEAFMGYLYFMYAPPDGEAAATEARRLVHNLHMFDVLRADRCMSRFGLELRVPFLDRDLLQDVLNEVPGKARLFQGGVEKALLRDAFRNEPCHVALEEARILNRQKERLSDGCGLMFVPMLLQEMSELDVRDENTANTDDTVNDNNDTVRQPANLATKSAAEARVYRRAFESFYGTDNAERWVTKRELPEWCSSVSENNKTAKLVE